jgi:hypothetical protein
MAFSKLSLSLMHLALCETVLSLKSGESLDMRPDESAYSEHVDPADPEYSIGTFKDIRMQNMVRCCGLPA